MNIVAIGKPSFITGFKLAGVKTKEVDWEQDTKEELDQEITNLLEKDEVGIIVMKEENLEKLSKRVRKKAEKSAEPVIVTLGGEGGRLREDIKRAIGIDLMEE